MGRADRTRVGALSRQRMTLPCDDNGYFEVRVAPIYWSSLLDETGLQGARIAITPSDMSAKDDP
eukprot:12868100-Heterocapsa_arctica.AAC.1